MPIFFRKNFQASIRLLHLPSQQNKTQIFLSHTLQKLKKNDTEAIMKFSFNKGTGINGDKFVSPR